MHCFITDKQSIQKSTVMKQIKGKQIQTSHRLISVSLSNVLYCIYDVSVVSRCTLYLNKILFTLNKRAHDPPIVRAKESLKLSHSGPCQRQTDPRMKPLRQGSHCVCDLTRRRLFKVGTIALNRDWVYNQTCRLSHGGIHVISNFLYNV